MTATMLYDVVFVLIITFPPPPKKKKQKKLVKYAIGLTLHINLYYDVGIKYNDIFYIILNT